MLIENAQPIFDATKKTVQTELLFFSFSELGIASVSPGEPQGFLGGPQGIPRDPLGGSWKVPRTFSGDPLGSAWGARVAAARGPEVGTSCAQVLRALCPGDIRYICNVN